MPLLNRRSFLGLLGTAVAAKVLPDDVPIDLDLHLQIINTFRGRAWGPLEFVSHDTVQIRPDMGLGYEGFYPPLPDDFRVTDVRCYVPSSIKLEDLVRLVDACSVQVECDGKLILGVPLPSILVTGITHYACPPRFGFGIRPRKDFRVAMNGDRDILRQLTAPVEMQIAVSGYFEVKP